MLTDSTNPAKPPQGAIVIDLYQFTVSLPFKEGHVLTSIEANILNWHRADLIQKIAYRWITQLKAEHPNESVLPFHDLDILQERITYLDLTYQLSPRKPPKQSFLDRELTNIATQYLKHQGLPNPTSNEIQEAKQSREIRDFARRQIKSRFDDLLPPNGDPQ